MPNLSVKKFRYPAADVPHLAQRLEALDPPVEDELELKDVFARPDMVKALEHVRKIGYTNDRIAEMLIELGIDVPYNAMLLAVRKAFAHQNPRRMRRTRKKPDGGAESRSKRAADEDANPHKTRGISPTPSASTLSSPVTPVAPTIVAPTPAPNVAQVGRDPNTLLFPEL